MKLKDYLSENNITLKEFALAIGVSSPTTVLRYANLEQYPRGHKIMQAIYTATNGQVTPADFYDLPPPVADAATPKQIN
jgi:transcriptional regulator with XRE-family HTH domain